MEETKELSSAEISRAFTNDPVLSTDDFQLGDRTFKVVDLGYDDYITFMTMLEPLLSALVGKISAKSGLKLPDIDLGTFTISGLTSYCKDSLPEMVRIICSQTDPTITIEEVKTLGKTPFKLAEIVIIQVNRNGIVKEFTAFFGQILRLMKAK